jgi:hypothetical protein
VIASSSTRSTSNSLGRPGRALRRSFTMPVIPYY